MVLVYERALVYGSELIQFSESYLTVNYRIPSLDHSVTNKIIPRGKGTDRARRGLNSYTTTTKTTTLQHFTSMISHCNRISPLQVELEGSYYFHDKWLVLVFACNLHTVPCSK